MSRFTSHRPPTPVTVTAEPEPRGGDDSADQDGSPLPAPTAVPAVDPGAGDSDYPRRSRIRAWLRRPLTGEAGLTERGVVLLAAAAMLVLWLAAGMPATPVVAAVGVAVFVTGLPPVLSRSPRGPMIAGASVGSAILIATSSLSARLLVAGAVTVAVLITTDRRCSRPVHNQPGPDRPAQHRPRHRMLSPVHRRARPLVLVLAAGLALTGLVGITIDHVTAARHRAAQDQQASDLNRAQLLPPTPEQAAHALLQAVAYGDPTVCTLLLAPDAAGQLTTLTGSPDCPSTIHQLAARVTDMQRYPSPDRGSLPRTHDTATRSDTIDACHLTWHPIDPSSGLGDASPTTPQVLGPQLGRLDLVQVLGQGYQITAIHSCLPERNLAHGGGPAAVPGSDSGGPSAHTPDLLGDGHWI